MAQGNILIVEDDEAIRKLVQTVAQRQGFTTSYATHGGEAIAALGDGHYCVVILDLMMPGIDGYDVIMHIRDNSIAVPVIVMTAVVRGLEWSKLDKSIVKCVLTKPFDVERLSLEISNACGQHASA